jgi:hypothetical protein
MSVLNKAAGDLSGAVPFTPQQLVAGLTPTQINANAQGMQTAQGQANYATEIADALKPFATGQRLDIESNPYARGALDAVLRRITDQYTNVTMPGIKQQAQAQGGVGGSRQGVAQALASKYSGQQVVDTSATFMNDLYKQNWNQMLQSQQQLPQVFQWQQQPFAVGKEVGKQEQDVLQAQKDAALNIWKLGQTKSQNAANIISQVAGQGSAQTTNYPEQNQWMSALGGALAGSQIYNMVGGGN